MKKLICLLLAVLLVVSLWGCDSDTDSGSRKKKKPSSTSPESSYGENITSNPDGFMGGLFDSEGSQAASDPHATAGTHVDPTVPPTGAATAPTMPPTGTATDSTVPMEPEAEITLGQTDGSFYYNDYFEIYCDLPQNWLFYSEEQLLALSNIVLDTMDKNVAEAIKNADILYCMQAQSPDGILNTGITMENTSGDLPLTLRAILELQIPNLKTSFANMGYTNIQCAYQTVTIHGREYDALVLSAQINGITYYSTSIAYVKNSYLVTISTGSLYTDETAALLSCYTLY